MIEQLQKRSYDRFLLWKRVTYWLNTPDFQRSYMNVSRTDNKVALKHLDRLVESGDLLGLRDWTTRHTDLDNLSYRQLRERAKLENVYNYSRLSKSELLEKLHERQDRANQADAEGTGKPIESRLHKND
jgi:hypothetical protein